MEVIKYNLPLLNMKRRIASVIAVLPLVHSVYMSVFVQLISLKWN